MNEDPEKLIEKAEKCTKKSFFNWSPDYDQAIEYLKKASGIYFSKQDYKKAAETYEKTSLYYKNTSAHYHAANQQKEAANCYRLLNEYDRMFALYVESAKALFDHGSHDSGINTLLLASDNMVENNPSKAAYATHSAACLMSTMGRYLEAAKTFRRSADLYAKAEDYDKAGEQLRQSINTCVSNNPDSDSLALCHRDVIKLVVMKLMKPDTVAAASIVREATEKWGFHGSEHYNDVNILIEAIEQEDGEEAAKAAQSNAFRNMEYHFQSLVGKIPLPKVTKPSGEENSTVKNPSSNLISAPTDDVEEDIC